jgi:hypothetical protein
MAVAPDNIEQLDMRDQLARIDEMQARLHKMMQETRLATPQTFFEGGLVMTALIITGAMLA